MTAVLSNRQAAPVGFGWPTPLDDDALADSWADAWSSFDCEPPAGPWQALELAWSEPLNCWPLAQAILAVGQHPSQRQKWRLVQHSPNLKGSCLYGLLAATPGQE
jgi:hypothetical protein